jgi:hypothetical protein
MALERLAGAAHNYYRAAWFGGDCRLLSREQTILKPRMLIFGRRDATLRAFLLSAYLDFSPVISALHSGAM